MHELLAHATKLGVQVHVAHLPAPYRGYYDSVRRMVVYGFDLTHIERRCVLAHELGHAYFDHSCRGDKRAEEAADDYAAQLLVDPDAYARLEGIYPADVIAEELQVTTDVLELFARSSLTRLHGVTYSRTQRGRARHSWADLS